MNTDAKTPGRAGYEIWRTHGDFRRWEYLQPFEQEFWDRIAAAAIAQAPQPANPDVAELLAALEPFAELQSESLEHHYDSPPQPRPADQHAWGFNRSDLTWGHFNEAARVYAKYRGPK